MKQRDLGVGSRLITWRKKLHIKQLELAEMLGVTRQRLSDWEHNGVPAGDKRLVERAMADVEREEARF